MADAVIDKVNEADLGTGRGGGGGARGLLRPFLGQAAPAPGRAGPRDAREKACAGVGGIFARPRPAGSARDAAALRAGPYDQGRGGGSRGGQRGRAGRGQRRERGLGVETRAARDSMSGGG